MAQNTPVPSADPEGRVMPEAVSRRVVVGVDGSASSLDSLRWAYHQARLTGARTHAVIAWSYPVAFGFIWDAGDGVDLAADAGQVLAQAVKDALGDEAVEHVTTHVVQGHPASVLVEVTKPSDVLVVGSHGHGGFVGALLGSVSQYVVAHAPCPVVVVRHGPGPRTH